MKNSVILAVLLLLSAVMVAEAQRFPGVSLGGGGGQRCGPHICLRGQRCINVRVSCSGAPCSRLYRCA
ncbi:hypothetical protein V5799_007495 [Amblyomma americanum]|uniref:Putative secreted protein n=1 Tax=Amblyomma americanum TaxID=6943 RepID=A0A0C9R3C9_AMBAM